MEYAVGEICAYLDPDEALYPEVLEKPVHRYTENVLGLAEVGDFEI